MEPCGSWRFSWPKALAGCQSDQSEPIVSSGLTVVLGEQSLAECCIAQTYRLSATFYRLRLSATLYRLRLSAIVYSSDYGSDFNVSDVKTNRLLTGVVMSEVAGPSWPHLSRLYNNLCHVCFSFLTLGCCMSVTDYTVSLKIYRRTLMLNWGVWGMTSSSWILASKLLTSGRQSCCLSTHISWCAKPQVIGQQEVDVIYATELLNLQLWFWRLPGHQYRRHSWSHFWLVYAHLSVLSIPFLFSPF